MAFLKKMLCLYLHENKNVFHNSVLRKKKVNKVFKIFPPNSSEVTEHNKTAAAIKNSKSSTVLSGQPVLHFVVVTQNETTVIPFD